LYEQGAESVRVYRLDGTYVGGVSPSTFFFEARLMDVAPDGDIWVADFHANHIKRFDRTTSGWIESQVIPTDSPPNAVAPKPLADDAMFNTVQDIAFGSDGTGYAVDYMNNRIVRFTPDGHALNACLDRPSAGWPKGVAIDPVTDDVWFPQPTYNLLGIIRPDCTPVATLRPEAVPGFKALNDPQAIAIRATDRIAFIADKGNGRILAYDVANRTPLAVFGSPGSGQNQFNSPRGIAIHPVTGTILVADSGNDRIVELSYEGGVFRWIRTLGEALFTWGHPQGVAADRSGRIYAADTGRNQVLVMDATGTLLSTIPDLAEPTGITVSQADEVFVADTHNDRIRVYTYGPGNRLINPGFENDFQGWSGGTRGQLTTSDVHGGGKAALFSSSTVSTNFFAQTVSSVPTGRYSASVWYKRIGSIKWAHLGVKVRNPGTGAVTYNATNAMRITGAWSQARLDDIPVTSGDVVQVSVWMEMNAGGALYLDDALLQ
jgi:DNA-binding beta-propeller fold protein YncE